MDRAKALKVVSEICQVSNGLIKGISLNKISESDKYAIFLKVNPQNLPRQEIQPILDKYELMMKEEENSVYITSNLNRLLARTLMDRAKQAIIDSIDIALNAVPNKDQFYKSLKEKYRLNLQEIPTNYDVFYEALVEVYGVEHFKLERNIVRALHNLVKMQVYTTTEEIPAVNTIVNNHIEESNYLIEKGRQCLEKSQDKLAQAINVQYRDVYQDLFKDSTFY